MKWAPVLIQSAWERWAWDNCSCSECSGRDKERRIVAGMDDYTGKTIEIDQHGVVLEDISHPTWKTDKLFMFTFRPIKQSALGF